MGQCLTTEEPWLDLKRYQGRWHEVARTPRYKEEYLASSIDYYQGEEGELIMVERQVRNDFSYDQTVKRVRLTQETLGPWKILLTDYQNFAFLSGEGVYRILSRRHQVTDEEREQLEERTLLLNYLDNELVWLSESEKAF
jgi:lipocalin